MAYGLLILIVMALTICRSSAHGAALAISEQMPLSISNAAGEFLEAHNQARAEVGVGPLKWSEQLANITRQLVQYHTRKGCNDTSNYSNVGNYGSNNLWTQNMFVTPSMAVDFWVQSKKYYDQTYNSCSSSIDDEFKCESYKQVVWRKSLELGCAQATCVEEEATVTLCFYDPRPETTFEVPY